MKVAAALFLALVLTGAGPAKKIDVGQWSYGLAAGGKTIWVGGLSDGDVLRIDPKTGKVLGRVAVGPRIFDLAASPGAVWAVSNALGTLTRIDTRTGRAGKPVGVGLEPYGVGWGFGSVWVSNAGDGTVWRITNGRVAKRIRVGVEPNGLTAYRGSLWVSDHTAGKLLRIDPHTNSVTGSVKLAGADWVTGFGTSLYVSQETNRVARVDVGSLKVLGVAKVGRNPLGSAIVANRLWVPCIDANEIDVVDPATMKVVARKAAGPSPIVVLPAFGHVWVSHTTGDAIWRYKRKCLRRSSRSRHWGQIPWDALSRIDAAISGAPASTASSCSHSSSRLRLSHHAQRTSTTSPASARSTARRSRSS